MNEFLRSTSLLLVLLNPFLVIVYLLDVVSKLEFKSFVRVMIRSSAVSVAVFWLFALIGDTVFSKVVQAEFASFQIFGGIVFLLIGIEFVLHGFPVVPMLRGDSDFLAGAIAMPILIGPGTISASIIVGKRLDFLPAMLAIFMAVAISVVIILALKRFHDYVMPRREVLVKRYVEIAGRVTALYVGTISVEMIMTGLRTWIAKF